MLRRRRRVKENAFANANIDNISHQEEHPRTKDYIPHPRPVL